MVSLETLERIFREAVLADDRRRIVVGLRKVFEFGREVERREQEAKRARAA